MAYAYETVGPYTCDSGAYQSVTLTCTSGGSLVGIGIQNKTSSAYLYPMQMYIGASNKAYVNVVNTGTANISWAVWLVVDSDGSTINISASYQTTPNEET